MNKTLLTIMLLTLALALSAQTGLFDISYGMSMQEAIVHLDGEGFTVANETDDWLELVASDNDYVESIELSFSEDGSGLKSWLITYLDQDEEDIEDLVIEALDSRHGYDWEWDDSLEVYIWDIGDGHWAYAYWDWSYETFIAEYTTE